jgi:hypothetical protein
LAIFNNPKSKLIISHNNDMLIDPTFFIAKMLH